MRKSTALLDRLVAAILGLILLAGGALGLAAVLDVAPMSEWTDGLRPSTLTDAVAADWFTWVLAAAVVLGFVLSIGLLAANVDRRIPRTTIDEDSDGTGEIRFHLGDVADGVAKHLRLHPEIRRARGRAEIDRGTDTITLVLDVEHDADVAAVRRLCEEAARDVDAAIGDAAGVRFLVHYDRPPAQ
ncbi:hypothetical protein [uncultured Corynebacterium sp.]|uniref:hypothetical protein n=1 Tax=uncultured Corynebacterium sp. TaxID=159447 RepID=UPI0025F63000|nr:hypothetical protein [uncultured Corynebacterium sp.]